MKSKHPPYSPPKWANRFLEWYCSDLLIDEIQGDLNEAYRSNLQRYGTRKANWYFVKEVLAFFRASSFEKKTRNSNALDMYRNYFKSAFRNFINNKVYSLINLSGLVVGITCCLLISLHVLKEFSYDQFHEQPENIYRVVMDMYKGGTLSTKSAPVYPAVGPNMVEDLPEVTEFVRILPFGSGVYSVKGRSGELIRFNEDKAVFADHNFFQLFGFNLLQGNPQSVLSGKNQTVLSQSAAKRYFGSQNPIGQTIFYRGNQEMTVTGVMQDFPENSHMQFDIISSLNTWDGFEEWPGNWGWYDFYTFIKTTDNTDLTQLTNKVVTYLNDKKQEEYAQAGTREALWLQNVGDIHLFSKGISWDMGENGGGQSVYFLALIAGLILLIAWVNFVNLSTARAVKRAKEVGIRKVVGAGKHHLVNQFIAEAFIYNAAAIFFAMLLTLLIVPIVNPLLDITLDSSFMWTREVLLGAGALVFLGTVMTGLYPAFVLTGFKPLLVLKGNFYSRRTRFGFRQVLVVFQFSISIVLILGTLLVVKQLKFMQSRDLGLNIEQTLVIKAPSSSRGDGDLSQRKTVFASKLEQLATVRGFTSSNVVPGVENFSISDYFTRANPKERNACYRLGIDENYFADFGIQLLDGRNFQRELASDSLSVVLNREAVKSLGFGTPENAVGEVLNPGSRWEWKIIGVVEDYHHSSLKKSLDPMAFFYRPQGGSFYSLKINTSDLKQSIASIESVWDEIYPDNPFDFFFLDDFFDKQYKSDRQFNAIFIGFAAIGIFVACLGLFGLVAFTTEQSRKEIGIRKVLGASIFKILLLLGKDYLILILAAIVIGFPVGYYLMKGWLEEFAYRTPIGPLVFIAASVIITAIAIATVSFRSLRVAKSNPVEALRDE